ncbi:hypothetical protein [Mucilaginibacter sp.]
MNQLEKAKRAAALLRFKPDGPPPAQPHNMPLYHDINTFVKEIFTLNPTRYIVYASIQELIHDLEMRFNGKYNVDKVKKMLTMGDYWSELHSGFVFKRIDFILEA